ncbi:MAG: aldehyde dehydrogenase family protein, partial [Sphingorhabdus sp.]|nr:aldehyde dehydrogenase family protein [Sphingorhabdus sp.]
MVNYPTKLESYINGAWRAGGGGETHAVINPATGETLAMLPLVSAADLDEALVAAEAGFKIWRKTDVNERAAKLHGVAELIRTRADAIATLLTMEQGKPIAEARGEVVSCAAV